VIKTSIPQFLKPNCSFQTFAENRFTALREYRIEEKQAVREAATICPVPLTFWPWKWCPSHLWLGLPPCQLVFLCLSVLDFSIN